MKLSWVTVYRIAQYVALCIAYAYIFQLTYDAVKAYTRTGRAEFTVKMDTWGEHVIEIPLLAFTTIILALIIAEKALTELPQTLTKH